MKSIVNVITVTALVTVFFSCGGSPEGRSREIYVQQDKYAQKKLITESFALTNGSLLQGQLILNLKANEPDPAGFGIYRDCFQPLSRSVRAGEIVCAESDYRSKRFDLGYVDQVCGDKLIRKSLRNLVMDGCENVKIYVFPYQHGLAVELKVVTAN